MPPCLRRTSPDPGLGTMIELRSGHARSLLNLTRIGKTLAREGIAAEEPPPAFLQIEPTRAFGNEDVLEARVLCQPGARFQAVMTAQIVGDNENVAGRIVSFNVLEELNVVLGITRSRTARDLFAIADAQRSIDPHLVIPATVLQRSLDTMAIH